MCLRFTALNARSSPRQIAGLGVLRYRWSFRELQQGTHRYCVAVLHFLLLKFKGCIESTFTRKVCSSCVCASPRTLRSKFCCAGYGIFAEKYAARWSSTALFSSQRIAPLNRLNGATILSENSSCSTTVRSCAQCWRACEHRRPSSFRGSTLGMSLPNSLFCCTCTGCA